jgi:hypothetical protein
LRFFIVGIIIFLIFGAFSATENYSEGARIGFLTKFSHKGRYFKSWEGELNLTQTGMNTSSLFDFSIDNSKEDKQLIETIDAAVNNGWKVKLKYHQTYFKNWFDNRGETNYFINSIEVLDKKGLGNNNSTINDRSGRVIDTIYVVIDKNELKNRK